MQIYRLLTSSDPYLARKSTCLALERVAFFSFLSSLSRQALYDSSEKEKFVSCKNAFMIERMDGKRNIWRFFVTWSVLRRRENNWSLQHLRRLCWICCTINGCRCLLRSLWALHVKIQMAITGLPIQPILLFCPIRLAA